MSTRTKGTSVIATLVLAAVVVLGYQFVGPKTGQPTNDRIVIVTGVWLPSPRNLDGVHVLVTGGTSLMVDRVFTLAPFQRSFTVQKGDRVEVRLRLTGQAPATFLGCSIAVDGTEKVNEHKEGSMKTGDSISCWTPA